MPRRYRLLHRTVAEYRRPHQWPLSRSGQLRCGQHFPGATQRHAAAYQDRTPPRAAAASHWKRGEDSYEAPARVATSSRCTKNKPLFSSVTVEQFVVPLVSSNVANVNGPKNRIPSAFASQTNPSSTAGVITNDGSGWSNA